MALNKVFGLGRNPSPKDERDYKLGTFISNAKELGVSATPLSKAWNFLSDPLDQGATNHCVGFSGADFGINLPIQDSYVNADGDNFYYKCKVLDGEPGAENGSNVRSIAKVLKAMGLIESYAFASSVEEITYWLLNKGPMIVGTDWTRDMFTPSEDGFIRPTGVLAGGHAYMLNEKCPDPVYGGQNSWGPWGLGDTGKFYITVADFKILFLHGGEALAAVEIDHALTNTQNKGCVTALFKLFGLK